jgi:putative RecB family exonuclease
MPGVAWAANGSFMTITDPKTLARLRKSELSASRSFDLDPGSCAVGLVKGVVLPREDDIFGANQLGTGAHAVLEALFQLPQGERTKECAVQLMHRLHDDPEFAGELVDANYVEQLTNLNDEDLARWYDEIQRRVLGLWEIEDPRNITVHFTEMSFGKRHGREIKVGRVPFVGFIDRVDQILDLTTGEVIGYKVIDYKAGKYKEGNEYGDDYADQVRLYVAAVKAAEGIEPESGALYFITYGKPRDIDTSPEKVDATIRRFERAWDRMHKLADENKYPTKVGPLCGWCELVNACPAAIKARKTDLSNTEKVNGKRVVVPGKEKKGLDRVLLGIPTLPPGAGPHRFDTDESTDAAAAPQPTDLEQGLIESAAHREQDRTERTTVPMTTTDTHYPITNGATRDAFIGDSLNSASFAAQAGFHLTGLAVQELTRADLAVNGANVGALAQTYGHIIEQVEKTLSGGFDWNSQLNARLRAALNTVVDTVPAPWGGTADQWNDWVVSAVKRTRAIASVATKLVNPATVKPADPWATLAGQVPASEEVAAAA